MLTGTINNGYGLFQFNLGKRMISGGNRCIYTLDGGTNDALADSVTHAANFRLPDSFDC